MAKQLFDHLNEIYFFDKFRSAQRPGFNSETVLLKVVNDSVIDINTENLVLLDLSAAFNTINHEVLLNCLQTTNSMKIKRYPTYKTGDGFNTVDCIISKKFIVNHLVRRWKK